MASLMMTAGALHVETERSPAARSESAELTSRANGSVEMRSLALLCVRWPRLPVLEAVVHPVHQIEQSSWTGLDRAEAWRTFEEMSKPKSEGDVVPSDSVQMAETLPVLHEYECKQLHAVSCESPAHLSS
mmetsp:Transcript_26601/g.54935  ORF Transcript_26601/g.54935 Transcript_26601/m.54935 type:complete len:130 (+) Transcript_26601:3-392(+)